MAESAEWPEPVDFVDESQKGVAQVNITIDEMKASKSVRKLGAYDDKNVTMEWRRKEAWVLWLIVSVKQKNGSVKTYEYKHGIKKEVNPEKTTCKIISPKKIGIFIAKKITSESWRDQEDYLTTNGIQLTPIPDE